MKVEGEKREKRLNNENCTLNFFLALFQGKKITIKNVPNRVNGRGTIVALV